ncbi:MAG: class I SAM-dependent methyltransferase [Planctomycetia bacterium]|nr:class I SAM-dependent methyltransferase [Planctomycetia bacterium]
MLVPLPGRRPLRIRELPGVHPLDPYAPDFAAQFRMPAGGSAWDLGCGAGLYGCAAAAFGAGRVLMTDTDPAAVSCALRNARRNGLAGVDGRVGSLFAPARGERFDLIMTSVPQLPAPGPVLRTRFGGPDGLEFFRPLARGAARRLRPGGRLYALVTGWAGPGRVRRLFLDHGLFARTVLAVERAFQPAEYEAMRPGLFDYLRSHAAGDPRAWRRDGSWSWLRVELLEARAGR